MDLDWDDSIAIDSDAEVDALDTLQSLQPPNRFLSDSGHVASQKFISAHYPERDFARTDAPKDLAVLIRDLAPLLPRHEAPWGDGIDYAERILARSHRLRAIKHNCQTFASIALNLWTDIKNKPAALADHKTPGTPTYFFLAQACHLIRHFRRHVYVYASESLTKRGRRRREILSILPAQVRDLRAIARDARKKLGLAGTVHGTAHGVGPLHLQPIMTIPSASKHFNLVMQSMHSHFHINSELLYRGYPDIQALQSLMGFLRYINLDDVVATIKPPPKRSMADSDGDDASGGDNEAQQVASAAVAVADAAAANLLRYLKKIRWENSPERLSFANAEQLSSWKSAITLRLHKWFVRIQARKDLLKCENHRVLVHFITIVFAQAKYWPAATIMAEFLVLIYRDEYMRDPKDKSMIKRVNLCNALGAFATCAARCSSHRRIDAVLAAENALMLLRPIYNKHKNRMAFQMSRLRVAYSQALLALGNSAANDAIMLFLFRKAYLVANWSIASLRKAVEVLPSRLDLKSSLAQGLRARATAAKAVLDQLMLLREEHTTVPLPIRETTVPKCCAHLSAEESQYLHTTLGDSTLTSPKLFLKSATEAIVVYRSLAERQPDLYTFVLAETLRWRADLREGNAVAEIAALNLTAETYRRLAPKFPGFFDAEIARARGEVGLRHSWSCRAEEAASSFSSAIAEYSAAAAATTQKADKVSWRGFHVHASLTSAHASVLAQLERPEAALHQAERAETILRSKYPGKKSTEIGNYLAEPLATKGYALWMLHKPIHAQVALRAALHLLERHESWYNHHYTLLEPYEASASPQYVLLLAWLAGVRCALGDPQGALGDAQAALVKTRKMVKSAMEKHAVRMRREPLERLVPHVLAIHAGISLELGRFAEAGALVDECLALAEGMKKRARAVAAAEARASRDKTKMVAAAQAEERLFGKKAGGGVVGGTWLDAPTYKTAVLIKVRVLEATERACEAALLEAEAETLPAKGFFDQLQQATLYDETESLPRASDP
ncbi:hypothetical protein OC834_004905 [Tilletia horrida]|nr:hypothetical protein OC834_004905 [Tilletia horrida]